MYLGDALGRKTIKKAEKTPKNTPEHTVLWCIAPQSMTPSYLTFEQKRDVTMRELGVQLGAKFKVSPIKREVNEGASQGITQVTR